MKSLNLKIYKRIITPVLLIVILCSCAKIIYEPSTPKDDSKGIRYYNSSPYLLVYSNGKGGLVTQIIYLPDPQKKMTATPKAFLASNQMSMEFEKGVYKSAKNSSDGTIVPSSIIKAVETVAPALLAVLNEPAQDRKVPAPYLYKIILKGSTIEFVGNQGDTPIKVDILKQSEEKTK